MIILFVDILNTRSCCGPLTLNCSFLYAVYQLKSMGRNVHVITVIILLIKKAIRGFNLVYIYKNPSYFSPIANSGLSFFFSICCLAKSVVTNANAPQVTLASPNSVVPLNAPAIVTPNVPMANPHGILLFVLFISFLTCIVIYKLVVI